MPSVYEKITEDIKQCIIEDMKDKEVTGEELYVYFHPVKSIFSFALYGHVGLRKKIKEIISECFGEKFDRRNHISEIKVKDGTVTIAYLQPAHHEGKLLERWEEAVAAVIKISHFPDCSFELTTDSFNVLPLCEYEIKGGKTDLNKLILPALASETNSQEFDARLSRCVEELQLPEYVNSYIDYTVYDKFKDAVVTTEGDGDTVAEQIDDSKEQEDKFIAQILKFFKDTSGLWGKNRPRKKSDLTELFEKAGYTEEYTSENQPEEQPDKESPLEIADEVLNINEPTGICEDSKEEYEEDIEELLDMNTDEIFFYSWMR